MDKDVLQKAQGVVFRRLSCHGSGTAARLQVTFASYALAFLQSIAALLRLKSRPDQRVQILHNLDGLILPGEMLLVLGRPGSGCSTFLKALGGMSRGFHVDDKSRLEFHGMEHRQMHTKFKGQCIYVAELDVHFPELSLGQTLDFAAATQEHSPDDGVGHRVASRFGLAQALHTKIGDTMIRGISGGEKRRTSIAEAFIREAPFQCWDNSTRGLDSLTALRFVNILRESTDSSKSSVAMSLYQASDGMYKQFDKVMLLYEGRQIFFGPVDAAVSYFEALGFVKPQRSTTPDFLTSLSNPAERVIAEGFEARVPKSPDDFATAWDRSREASAVRAEIDASSAAGSDARDHHSDEMRLDPKSALPNSSIYPLSIHAQINICAKRALQRMRNNSGPVISTVIANTILGIIIGSVFYDTGETTDDIQPRAILLFFALTVNAFAPAAEASVLLMWAQRPIVEKHHRYAFYHPFTERLSSIICDLPVKFLMSFGIHIPIYFLSNLHRTAGGFFIYWLFMFTNLVTMSLLFRMIGSMSRSRDQILAPVSALVLLCIIYTGFVVPPPDMVPWLGWFRYINPVAYTYESLMINEFHGRIFPCATTIPQGVAYANISVADRTCPTVGSQAGQSFVQGTAYIAAKYGYSWSHIWRNLGIVLAMMTAFCVLHLIAAEMVPARPSRGEVLVFKRHRPTHQPKAQDEEANVVPVSAGNITDGIGADPGGQFLQEKISTATIHWQNLSYGIKTKDGTRAILTGIDGWIKPGTLTALMGPTGAGKTSLLDVLAGRNRGGTVSGEVYVNGYLRDSTFGRRIGYVQQEDIHVPTATVREALQFSALMRQPRTTPKAEKLEYVETVLRIMDMARYADAIIGVPGESLNVEQRKRLTIAVEVVAKPEFLLFLDEPTSGLDSQTAWSICTLLRQLADYGQTILCTIHQPSSQLFAMFDRLLLLNNSGKTLYFGEVGQDASTLVNYFESNGAPECRQGENPAEWMFEITRSIEPSIERSEPKTEEWSEKWQQSQQRQSVLRELSDHLANPPTPRRTTQAAAAATPAAAKPNKHNTALPLGQLTAVTVRTLRDQWRDPVYLYTKLVLCTALALANGISFYYIALDIQGLTSLLFSIFLISQAFSTVDQLIIPRLTDGARVVFEARERHTHACSWPVFVAAAVLVEALWQTLVSVPMFVAWYYPTGLQRNGDASIGTAERGALVFVLIWLFNLWSGTLSQAFAVAFSYAEVAVQMATLCFWLGLVFCGILVTPDNLPRFWIFMYRVSPLTYFFEGLAVAGLANTSVTCSPIEMQHIPLPPDAVSSATTCLDYLTPFIQSAGGYVANPDDGGAAGCWYCPVASADAVLMSFGMDARHAWRDVGIFASYVCFNVLATFGIYWLVRVPRRRKVSSGAAGRVE